VHGDSLESFLVAVVVPEERHLLDWAKSQGLSVNDPAALYSNPKVRAPAMWLLD
jgi:hypothetical protein